MFSDDLKKFVKILEFCDAGPYSSEELEQALRRIVLFPAHVKRFIDLLKLEVVAFHLEWPDPEVKWNASLLGTDILKLMGVKGDTTVKMELPLRAYGNIMMVAGFTGWETEAPQPHPDPSQIKVMEFVRAGPYEASAFGPALSRVCVDQLKFTVLLHSVMDIINRWPPHSEATTRITVTINEARDMLCFDIGQFAGRPLGQVYAELGVIGDELKVIGELLMAGDPSGKSARLSPLDNLVHSGPISGRDLASRLILVCDRVTSDRIGSEINQHVRACNAGDPLQCWYRFSFGNMQELTIEVIPDFPKLSNDYPKLIYRLEKAGGVNNPTTLIGDLIALQPGNPARRWSGSRMYQWYRPGMGMGQGYPYSPQDPFGESFHYPRFSIPRWGMYSADPRGFGGYARGEDPMNISMPVRSYQEIERVVEMLAERSPAVHPQLSMLQQLMHTGTGTAADPFQSRQFIFSVQPHPNGSMVSLSEYEYNSGLPISDFTFIVRQ